MGKLWQTATSNAFNTTLSGNITAGDTTIVLTAGTNLQAPALLVIDRQDANGNDTASVREYISFTGITGGSTLTGVTRGLGGSTAQTHASGAKVEEVMSVTHWNDLIATLLTGFTQNGTLDTTKVLGLTSGQNASTINSWLMTEQGSTPTVPDSGTDKLYFKTDGSLYAQNSSGLETGITTNKGWANDPNTWTYSAVDGNTYTLTVNSDVTSLIDSGYRFQCVQAKLAPTAYYRFETGAVTTDASGNGFTLTNNNTVTNATGMFGQGADFGSGNTNKYLNTTNTLGIDGGTMSVSMWVKLDAEIASGTFSLFDQVSNTSKVEYLISYTYNSGNRALNFSRNKIGVSNDNAYTITTLGTASYHHIAMVYDATTSLTKAYLDGVLVATVTATGSGSGTGTAGVAVGASTAAANFASATVDDVAVFAGKALGASEIRQIYNNGTGLEYNSAVNFTKELIVSAKPTYAAGTSTITLYGGQNARLDNTTITSPKYSNVKKPFEFPLDPTLWTEGFFNDAGRNNAAPSLSTWYNLFTTNGSLAIPIGIWNVTYWVRLGSNSGSGNLYQHATTLSTTNNSETDTDFHDESTIYSISNFAGSHTRSKTLTLTSKTTYYLNVQLGGSSTQNGTPNLATGGLTIRAVSAYL